MKFYFPSLLDEMNAEKLLDTKELNISSVEILSSYLNSDERVLSSDNKGNVFPSFLENVGINEDTEGLEELITITDFNKFEELDKKEYISNPYLKLISKIHISKNKWKLMSLFYEPFEAFVYDEIKVDPKFYSEHTPMGYFKEKFIYPALIEGDAIWMSLIPHEINTMKAPINRATGDVLVLGLGLGYFAYMVSLKKEVKSVTVIEKDKIVIELFKSELLPHFENKTKIKIIEEDAREYVKKDDVHYDYCFVDIWHNVHDGLPHYLYFKKYEKENTAYDYWIETSLLAMLRRYLLTIFEELHYHGYTDENSKVAENEDDKIINDLYFLTKDYEFNNTNEFHKFLSDESIKKLITYLKIH